MQAGMTVLNTKTGEIVAVGGGRNFRPAIGTLQLTKNVKPVQRLNQF